MSELNKYSCFICQSLEIKVHSTYSTQNHGCRQLFECIKCKNIFSETKNSFMEGIVTPISKIAEVIKARTEGFSLNATVRALNVAKNTILNWERRLSNLKQTLLLYALLHEFIKLEIEGDELYTKVDKNVPPDESLGWTIVLMDRASRFIWELECGYKDREMFKKAIETLCDVIERTGDLSLFTDGERRYGNILFELCNEVVKNGKPGRPPKALKTGVKVRLKNKGNKPDEGPKRNKYEAPHREHPETTQDVEDKDIHANHVEAFNASLRRKNSTYRRKTNTYAKSKRGLQRTLDCYWIVHNFVRIHFTLKKVPAVVLGILENGLLWSELLLIHKIA